MRDPEIIEQIKEIIKENPDLMCREIAEMVGRSPATVAVWLRSPELVDLYQKKRRGRVPLQIDKKALKAFIQETPSASLLDLARQFDCSRTKMEQVLEQHGLRTTFDSTRTRETPLDPKLGVQLCVALCLEGLNKDQAAEEFQISKNTLNRYITELEIPYEPLKAPLRPDQIREIEVLVREGYSACHIEEMTGCNYRTVYRYIRGNAKLNELYVKMRKKAA